MSQHYEKPQRDCDIFELDTDDDDFDLDPFESRGEIICDNCLSSATGHCPGQLDCDKWHKWVGSGSRSIDEKDMEPRTIGFHLLNSDSN